VSRDAFFCQFPTWPIVSKVRRYQQRILDAGNCMRCRQPRGRAGRYCLRCKEHHRLESQRSRARARQRKGRAA
jgi:hypothetical protein